MKIETHNKKFTYEIDSEKGVIFYKWEIGSNENNAHITTGRYVCSAAITPDDKYLYVLSKSNDTIYCYTINQISGVLIAMSTPQHAVSAYLYRLKISVSGLYLRASAYTSFSIYSINQLNGSLALYANEVASKILLENIWK